MEKIYSLEQGITSPRDGSVNWSPFDSYGSLTDAKREARKNLGKGKWRIVETKVVWTSATSDNLT